MGKEVDHVLKAGSEAKPEVWIAVITGSLHQEQLVGFEVEEVVQKRMGHQAEVVGTLGDVVVPMRNKPEVEEARTVIAKIVWRFDWWELEWWRRCANFGIDELN